MNFLRLVFTLSARDLRQRYRRSWFNLALVVLYPLFNTLVFTAVFSKIVRLDSEGVPYAVFCIAGIVPWTYTASCLKDGASCLFANTSLVTRLKFPRQALPLTVVVTNALPFLLNLCVVAAIAQVYGIRADAGALVSLVPVILLQAAFCAGLSALLSVAAAFVRPVRGLIPLATQAWLLFSPVIYSLDRVPDHWDAYRLNPMVGIIEAYRETLLHGRPADYASLLPALAATAAVCAAGAFAFNRLQRNVADLL